MVCVIAERPSEVLFFFGTNDELVLNSNSLEPAIVIYSLVLVLMKQFLHVGTLTHWATLNYT